MSIYSLSIFAFSALLRFLIPFFVRFYAPSFSDFYLILARRRSKMSFVKTRTTVLIFCQYCWLRCFPLFLRNLSPVFHFFEALSLYLFTLCCFFVKKSCFLCMFVVRCLLTSDFLQWNTRCRPYILPTDAASPLAACRVQADQARYCMEVWCVCPALHLL